MPFTSLSAILKFCDRAVGDHLNKKLSGYVSFENILPVLTLAGADSVSDLEHQSMVCRKLTHLASLSGRSRTRLTMAVSEVWKKPGARLSNLANLEE